MKYFTIDELTKSATARRYGMDNVPSEQHKKNLIALVENVLDPVREAMGEPIIVNSAYRNERLNALIGGARLSQHCYGEAADIQTSGDRHNKELFKKIIEQGEFDQLIWEFGNDSNPDWVHVSYRSKDSNRHQILRAVKEGGKTVYKTIHK